MNMGKKILKNGFKPAILLLYCAQSLADNTSIDDIHFNGHSASIKSQVIPCSSKIEVSHLLKILESGHVDGIEIVGCGIRQCRFLLGKNIAEKRTDYTRNLLAQIHMEPDRIGMTRADGLSVEGLFQIAHKRLKKVIELGPSPMRGSS